MEQMEQNATPGATVDPRQVVRQVYEDAKQRLELALPEWNDETADFAALVFLTGRYYDQTAVGHWHQETFGADCPMKAPVLKALEEARELAANPCAEEAADVVIAVMAYAARAGFNLADAVGDNLAKNKTRVWGKPDKNGMAQHFVMPTLADVRALAAEIHAMELRRYMWAAELDLPSLASGKPSKAQVINTPFWCLKVRRPAYGPNPVEAAQTHGFKDCFLSTAGKGIYGWLYVRAVSPDEAALIGDLPSDLTNEDPDFKRWCDKVRVLLAAVAVCSTADPFITDYDLSESYAAFCEGRRPSEEADDQVSAWS